jgi:hypothetical protein
VRDDAQEMVGWLLAVAALVADAAVIAATHSWTFAATYTLLAITWALSLAAFLSLRRRDDGSDGGSDRAPDPEPPWWPDFERQFRDYARRQGPGARRGPRTPAGAGRS